MKNNIDQLFRNKLETHKSVPSEAAWENLQSQLNGVRQARKQKWLSVAAAVVFMITATGGVFYIFNSQKTVENPAISQNEPARIIPENHSTKVENTGEAQVPHNVVAENDSPEEAAKVQETMLAEKRPIVQQTMAEMPVAVDETEQKTINEEELMLAALVPDESTDVAEEHPSDTVEPENMSKTQEEEQQYNTPVSVTITYKAEKNSPLVASKKGGVVNAGIEKITGFAEEHVFTDELKTKLRNTTGDVLALNFGKLINKQNKEN